MSLIPLTQQSVDKMYADLRNECNYTPPRYEDNPDDYPRYSIEIFPNEKLKSMVVGIWIIGPQHIKTWKEWRRLLRVVLPPLFGNPPEWSGDEEDVEDMSCNDKEDVEDMSCNDEEDAD